MLIEVHRLARKTQALIMIGALGLGSACAPGDDPEAAGAPGTGPDGAATAMGGTATSGDGPAAAGGSPSGGIGTGAGTGTATGTDTSTGSAGSGIGTGASTDTGSGGASAGGAAGADGLSPLTAPLPMGMAYEDWTWVDVPGALCRDGSPAGYYYRRGKQAPLMIFMNGGGTCTDDFFCGINPANVNENLPTEQLLDATGNLLLGADLERQFPHPEGIFKRDPRNPVGDWNMVYVPYCTGDVFAGTRSDVTVPNVDGTQQFVGYKNIGLFLESFGPSFANAGKVLLTGSSAGGFGTLINYDRVQTFFDKYKARVYGVTDSGIPFRDMFLEPCLQKEWRTLWGLDAALPKDCSGCFRTDGGGLVEGLGAYLFHEKYKDRALGGMVSTVEDGVIRAFFGSGMENCTAIRSLNTILAAFDLGGYEGATYRAGLKDTLEYVGKDKVSSFFMDSWEHMHLWRPRFYETIGGTTLAAWLADVLNDKVTHIGSTDAPATR